MPDFLDLKRKEIDDRLQQLRPAVEEAAELEEALSALSVVVNGRRTARTGAAAAASKRHKRGRPTAAELEARRKRALALIGSNPGTKVPGLALLMDLSKATLYNFLRTLEIRGEIAKDEHGGYRLVSGS